MIAKPVFDAPKKNGPRFIDISGEKFGMLAVVSHAGVSKTGKILWECLCDCGEVAIVLGYSLRSGHTKSCGCARVKATSLAFTKHGHTRGGKGSSIYTTWLAMIGRCHSPSNQDYKYYGARGITVCESWRNSFENFLSDMGHPPPGKSVDRKENNKGYSPDNCRWATKKEQGFNTRSNVIIKAMGISMTTHQFSEITGLSCKSIRARISRGNRTINGIEIEVSKRGISE